MSLLACLPSMSDIGQVLTYTIIDLPGHKDAVFAVDWSPDGQKVGSGGADKAIRIWRH